MADSQQSTESRLTDHVYDGIQEYDNPTPSWWHVIFLGTVVFSLFYMAYWHMSPLARTNETAWKEKQVADYKKKFGRLGELTADEPTIQKMMNDAEMMAIAQGTFRTNCAQCHASDGGGINGVNLTDEHYKNVKVLTDLHKVITEGANNGAMPSWRNNFSNNERVLLAAFVASLRGSKPANPKQAEGEVIPPWPTPPK